MGMILTLRQANRDVIARLLASPERISEFLFDEEYVAPVQRPGLISRLFGTLPPPATPAALPVPWPARRDGDEADLDKAWHGLHFLFTGTAWEGDEPECYLLRGGQEIGDEDVGYGPARALQPEQVRRFAEYLGSISHEDLRRRYDPPKMSELEIYPDIWSRDSGEENVEWEYLLENFDTLREFVAHTRDVEEGIVVSVT